MQGWIKLHRIIQDHWLYRIDRKFSSFEAWLDLLMMVNHEDKKVNLGNELIEVKRGQRVTSIRKLCDKWNWSNSKVKQFLNLLKDDGMIEYISDTKKTLITVVNYELYQSSEGKKATQYKQGTDTIQSGKNTNNNEKEIKNDKEINMFNRRIYDEQSIPYQLSTRLLNHIRNNNNQFKEPNLQKWSDDFRLMMERDNRSVEQIKNIVDWCQSDSFWKTNILSPSKLRQQFDQLILKLEAAKKEKTSRQQISLTRPSHWKEPVELTEDDLKKLRYMQEKLPY